MKSPSWEREYLCRYLGRQGTTFNTQDIERCTSFPYNPDEISKWSSRVIGLDPAWDSSAFGVCIIEFRDSKAFVVYADEFANSTHEDMVQVVYDLAIKYAPIAKILVDGAQIAFIKSLKSILGSEEVDYQAAIDRYKKMGVIDWTQNMMVVPVNYSTDNVKMLSHTRQLLQEGYVAIHPKFEKLLIAMHTATDQEGKLEKASMSHSDVFDALRQALSWYIFE